MSGGTSILGNAEPLSDKDQEAITWFRKAIDKESHGMMSDAVEYYRKAFKINEQVDALYRAKDVPHTAKKLEAEGGKNTLKKVDEELVKRINVDTLLLSFRDIEAKAPNPLEDESSDLTIKFANLGVDGHEEVADVKPVSPLVHLPNDIWIHILEILLITSPESWFSFAITCKKHAYLGLGTSDLWRKLCYLVYPSQVYEENKMITDRLGVGEELDESALPVPLNQLEILPQYNNSWKFMLNNRPFVKFLGCYISVVNYYSEGGKAEFSNSWSNPVRTITYYRYLRFYPDGTCVKVLSASEPNKVIPHLLKHSKSIAPTIDLTGVPQIKESQRIYHGRWTVSSDGEVHVVIENGSAAYYVFHYHFQVKSLAIFKHSKLSWVKYYAVKKEGHDDEGEENPFAIRNEKPFKFLRVRSYTTTN
ncbi:uncharacterized protein CANTADRAFT_45427 [Suhomyces tanzawaensis NRRL Y-17324]|uniref:F-box protein Hrt3/FBXO9 C-terminal domain-containing protein n=1 Tax=Suhomyces tanzawaensis NRRL Y-17324 TaxID=984487 RepID=A0A1E4SQD9_9ASCO|nr:uncharacterized protein CANTADRAFT_45427 [Suhomyces tanzawaensis NRRL Y-17324]ODV81721.1 hypothetical protein CANTADRAFT_45427 [Suhomyces tanzawaensis NRRL Y-17324]